MEITVKVHCQVRKNDREEYQQKSVSILFFGDDAPSDLEMDVASRREAISMLESMGYTDIEIKELEIP